MEIEALYKIFLSTTSVCIDTRKISEGNLFFALKGERFDANTFAAQALDKGAAAVVIDNPAYYIDHRTIVVHDVLQALQDLARQHRRQLGIPIIALTGSNGKTTTKELIYSVLKKKYRTGATVGNLNNHIGVPLTLLSFTSSTAIGIVEMGANHQREIAFLCGIAEPDYGYITNFGKAHLEGFGGVEGVIKGKSELYDFLFSSDKLAFINLDDTLQAAKSAASKRFTYGYQQRDADVVITDIRANPYVQISYQGGVIQSNLIGRYNANNLSAALAIGKYFDVPDQDIITALQEYTPQNNRSQVLTKDTNTIILDAYNANPSSMAAALDHFKTILAPHKLAILGDMFELGAESAAEHESIARLASTIDGSIYLVGEAFYATPALPNVRSFAHIDALTDFLKKHPVENSTLLIKGSRGMALERLMDYL